jgi:hypothetical protein
MSIHSALWIREQSFVTVTAASVLFPAISSVLPKL